MDKTKNVVQNSAADQQREFQARYVQEHHLGKGGSGAVFAGYRITDHFPVAIKHIPKDRIPFKVTDENGKEVSVEVAILLKLAAEADGSVGTSAPVSLLDWFDFGTELILVQERPVPAVDLFDYLGENGGRLPEGKAKVILKQLVDAAKDLEEKHIFHRDIKTDNILIETGSDVPRVRIIDFGLSCFATEQSRFSSFCVFKDIETSRMFYLWMCLCLFFALQSTVSSDQVRVTGNGRGMQERSHVMAIVLCVFPTAVSIFSL